MAPPPACGDVAVDAPTSVPAVGWQVRADVVERQRILRGWTRAQLTEAADIDPKTLRDLLNGRRHPTLGTVDTLCRALDVPLADVIAIIEQPRPAGRLAKVGGSAGRATAQTLLPLE
jgi:transcriptional regulator with XRE-family HTH domain